MASFYRVVFSGSSDTIPVPFEYLDKSFVEVRLDGVLLSSSDYTWPSSGQVKITAGSPAAGVVGETRRKTPAGPLVRFSPGNLDPSDLDTASVQAIHLAEEAKDNTTDIVGRAWYTSGFQSGGLITKAAAGIVPVYDALGNLVGGPSAAQVAAAEGYADTARQYAEAAATFDPNNFYTKAALDVIFGAYDLELNDLADGKADKAITIAAGGLATGGGDLSEGRTITVPKASVTAAQARTDDTVALTPLTGDKLCAERDAHVIHVRDQKASGTAGGAAGSTSVQRVLNTVLVNNITGASLASNDVTLPAGTYEADFSATQFVGAGTRLYLQTAAGTKLGASLNAYPSTSDNVQTTLRGNCRFTLAAPTAVRLQHYITAHTGGGSANLGLAVSDGNPEIYAELIIKKVD